MTGTSSVSGEDDAGDVPTLRRSPSAKASEQSSRGCGYEEQYEAKSDENRERSFFLYSTSIKLLNIGRHAALSTLSLE